MASRPDIVDRSGALLATDIRTVSLFAEPNKIVDADDAAEKLSTVLLISSRRYLSQALLRRISSGCAG